MSTGIDPADVRIFADHSHVPPDANQLVMIDDFIIDVALSEEHTYDSEVTEYPVEKGADITDNVRPKPVQVTIECLVSNTPVSPDILAQRDSDVTPSDEAYLRLITIRDNREPVTIRTSLNTFENMVLKSLSIPRSPGQGDALRFTATFVEVQIVSNTRTTRVAIPIATKPKTVTKAPTPVAKTGKSFNDSLPTYRVIFADDGISGGSYFWYDDAIAGWRLQAVHDAPAEGGGLTSALTNPYNAAGEGWVVFKDRPFGASTSEWLAHQDDTYWAARLSAASGNENNQFNPWEAIGVTVDDIRIVHAMRR